MTLVVDDEQGYGDTIQSIRHVGALAARGARVIVRVRDELATLVATAAGVDEIEPLDATPQCDAWVPAMSLPARLGVAPQGDGARPYLRADPLRVAAARAKLAPSRGAARRLRLERQPGPAVAAAAPACSAAPLSSATTWRGSRCSAATARTNSRPRRSTSTARRAK
jgi:hypothetical protein